MSGYPPRSHYQVLGVTQGAGIDEIRRAHRQLARVLHPDRLAAATPAERQLAERRMREVNAAWTVLSDPARRRDYDRSRQAAATGATAPGDHRRTGGQARRSSGHGTGAGPRSANGSGAFSEDLSADRAAELELDEEPMPAWQFWLFRRGPVIAALVVAAGLFVFTAYAGDGGDSSTRSTLPAQDCVRVLDGRTAVPTNCAGVHNGTIVTAVEAALDCPAGTKYVVIGGEFVCVDGDAGQPEGGGRSGGADG